jgi:hypothetical protein
MKTAPDVIAFPSPVEMVDFDAASLAPWVMKRFADIPEVHRRRIKVLTTPCAEQIEKFASYYFFSDTLYFDSDGRPKRTPKTPQTGPENWPFRWKLFRNVEETVVIRSYGPDEIARLRKWLYHRAIPFGREVYVCLENRCVLRTTWKILVKYWDILQGPCEDAAVFDDSLRWCLFLWHESTAYFGTNEPRTPDDLSWDGTISLFGPELTRWLEENASSDEADE